MSPAQFHQQNACKEPVALSALSQSSSFPLKINKGSHFIRKPSLSSSPPSSSSSSSSTSLVSGVTNVTNKSQQKHPHPQQRHPVIIYTHSPKVIHTHPKDFMALVQKLTGLSRSDQEDQPNHSSNNNHNSHNQTHTSSSSSSSKLDANNNNILDECNDDGRKKINKGAPAMAAMMMMNDDNDSTSVVTDDNNGGSSSGTTLGEAQVNSCFVPPPIIDPAPNPCFNSIPFFNPNSADFLCTTSHHHHHHQQHQPFYNYSDDSSLFFMPNIRSSLSSSTLEGMKELPDF